VYRNGSDLFWINVNCFHFQVVIVIVNCVIDRIGLSIEVDPFNACFILNELALTEAVGKFSWLISEDLFRHKFVALKQVETQVAIFVYIIRVAFLCCLLMCCCFWKKDPAPAGDHENKRIVEVWWWIIETWLGIVGYLIKFNCHKNVSSTICKAKVICKD
jgi:hypothetical protein